MPYMQTPLATVRAEIAAVLTSVVAGSGVKIYPEFPSMESVVVPSVVVQDIYGSGKEVGHGESCAKNTLGMEFTLFFQLDTYHYSGSECDALIDKAIVGLLANRRTLLSKGIRLGPSSRVQELQPDEPIPKNVYRRSVDWPFSIEVTRSAS